VIDECFEETGILDNDRVNILDTDPGDNIVTGSGLLSFDDHS
jgi:hypothetical protein